MGDLPKIFIRSIPVLIYLSVLSINSVYPSSFTAQQDKIQQNSNVDTLSNDLQGNLFELAYSDPISAIKEVQRSLPRYVESGSINELVLLYHVQGTAFKNLDQPNEALNNLNRAVLYLDAQSRPALRGDILTEMGNIYFQLDLFEQAKAQYEQGLIYYEKVNSIGKRDAVAMNLALIEKELGLYESAQKQYSTLLKKRRGLNKAFIYILLAELNLVSKNDEDSILVWLKAADTILVEDDSYKSGRFKGYVGEYRGDYYRERSPDSAAIAYNYALEWYQKHDFRLWLRTSKKMAELEQNQDKLEAATKRMHQVILATEEQISFPLWYEYASYYSRLLQLQGELDQAFVQFTDIGMKKLNYEQQRNNLSLSLLDFRNQISEARQTIELQKKARRDEWIITGIAFLFSASIVVAYVLFLRREKLIASQRLKLNEQRVALLESSILESRWRNLRLQLKPHFLYNILSSLQSLIHFKPERATKLIDHLAGYFQHILSAESVEMVPLKSEIALCREFLSLQEIRYDGQLQFTLNIEKELYRHEIPSMLIFPLVENAVKYGYKTTNSGIIEVDITIYKQRKELCIEIRNTGYWVDEMVATNSNKDEYVGGLGWQNIQQRLEHHYGNNAHLIHKQENDVVLVQVFLPIEST